jgi:CRISPR-associated endonuclease/helicase Cas3
MKPNWMSFWGKLKRQGATGWHPLACHMIDVAAVTGALWSRTLGAGLRKRLAETLSLNDEHASRWLALMGSLHDLGKATPGFQRMWPAARERLSLEGFRFPDRTAVPHGNATVALLPALLESEGMSRPFAVAMGAAVGGHHGRFPGFHETLIAREALGSGAWTRPDGNSSTRSSGSWA